MPKLLLTFLLFSFFLPVCPQENEILVKRSTDKIILEGKIYFIHSVREQETLHAISKAYNVSEKIIALENPDVFGGLKAGMVLKIPADPVQIEEITVPSTDEFYYHIVSAGETLYFLSGKYDVSVEEIEKYNPEVEYSDLQINQVVKIPKKQLQQSRDTFTTEDYFFHYVKKGETLYSLSVFYGVGVDEIKELNPELKWGELKFEEYIKIPRKPIVEKIDTARIYPDTSLIDTFPIQKNITTWYNWIEAGCDSLAPVSFHQPLKIGLFLPLFLNWQEMLDSLEFQDSVNRAIEGEESKKEKDQEELPAPPVNPRIFGYLDFYEGILLALDSLKNAGISVSLYVFDTERDKGKTEEMLKQKEVKSFDLIIGPAEEENLRQVADFGKDYKIPVISPFTECQLLIRDNPYLFQMMPSQEIEFRNWAEFLADYWNYTMILIWNGDSLELEKINFFKQEMYEQLAMKTYLNDVHLKEVTINDSTTYEMNQFLTQEDKNIIIIPSTNEAYVSKILTSLFFLLGEYDIQIFGMSNWHKFQSIDIEYLHQLEVQYFTSFFVDFNKPSVINFIKKFRGVYKTEPYHVSPRGYNLSIYGYDLTFYFASALARYGKEFIFCPVNKDFEPLLGPYLFRKQGIHSGYMNQNSSMIKYGKDLNIMQYSISDHAKPFISEGNPDKP